MGVLQLETQYSVRSVVGEQRLLRYNPHVTLTGHVVLPGIAEDYLSVFRAAGEYKVHKTPE